MKSLIKSNLLIAATIAVFVIAACNSKNSKPKDEKPKMSLEDSLKKAHADSVQVVIKKADRSLNDIAKFMAGMDDDTATVLKDLASKDNFIQHKTFMDAAWKKLDSVQLAPMAKWAGEELKNVNASNRDLWYPFSGPDRKSTRLNSSHLGI